MARGAVVLGAVGLFALGWGAGAGEASRPGRALRSRVVYPPQRIAIRMDHAHPAHRRLRCERCHAGASESEAARDRLIPREAACAPCHDDALDRERAGAETCGTCHLGEPTAAGFRVAASAFPAARLRFSHAKHARAGVPCLDCHAGVQEAGLATRQHLPTMRSCFRCHGGDGVGAHAEGADEACSTCHLSRPDGRLRTDWPEGEMLPPRWLHGMDHDRDFLVRHRWIAADEGPLCAECHDEGECVACHDGRVRPASRFGSGGAPGARVHRNDYLTTHAAEARRDTPRCASCHTTQRFCAECHARLGLSPVSAPAAASGRPFHPPGFAGAAHGMEARRSMTTCASCHSERDCVACHGATGIGAGLSPHPPGFAAGCASALERNPRACITCHGDAAGLAARCR
ncbi:MAG: cytochrome c family protein [Sandaracinus sp.]|nr:cytochrome c family protein [Sandaracinus sp.]MBJ73252.1 cytochrome c family protein [Sandaracinus sp.]